MSDGLILDLIIVVLALTAIFRGFEIGSLRQLFSTVGFFTGLFIGASIQPKVINLAHTTFTRTLITLATTLGLAFVFLLIGEFIGIYLKNKLHLKKLNTVDNLFGSVISVITIFFSIWLCAAIIGSLSVPLFQTAVDQSAIIGLLDKHLPGAPNIVSDLGSLIDPNGFPQVFIGNEPAPTNSINLPSLGSMQAAVNQDAGSVVKVQGLGCGGIVEGSGFIVGSNLVATNAHVVAGIKQPYVYDANGTHSARAIWFDPNLDFAILEVSNLANQPLVIDSSIAAQGTPGVVIGYPGGGGLSATPAAVLNEFNAVGRNIYSNGTTTRSVYELKANVIPGNSGGPLIEKNGDVLGIVFAQSTSYKQVGYALTANQIKPAISHAESQNTKVSTGNCAQ
ncbi:MAG TPA: MarP family serine protease [Candidatus Saccharimonadales bacterium]